MILRRGSAGPDVEQLQLRLKAAGYDPGDIDSSYGPRTEAAVLAFQQDRPDLEDDRVAGPATLLALDGAIVRKPPTPKRDLTGVLCNATTWAAFEQLRDALVANVLYGPGRGLWVGDRFVIGYAPGRKSHADDVNTWPNVKGKLYNSLHCTSLCNVVLSWLLRLNEGFQHAGNIPPIFDVCERVGIQNFPGGGRYYGFGASCAAIEPDGSGSTRTGLRRVLDARELYDRRDSMPTFVVFAQSTKMPKGWNMWHHTGLFVFRDGRMYRLAADGWKGPGGYSATPVSWMEVTPATIGRLGAAAYRCYGVLTADGSYGDPTKPIARVDFEK